MLRVGAPSQQAEAGEQRLTWHKGVSVSLRVTQQAAGPGQTLAAPPELGLSATILNPELRSRGALLWRTSVLLLCFPCVCVCLCTCLCFREPPCPARLGFSPHCASPPNERFQPLSPSPSPTPSPEAETGPSVPSKPRPLSAQYKGERRRKPPQTSRKTVAYAVKLLNARYHTELFLVNLLEQSGTLLFIHERSSHPLEHVTVILIYLIKNLQALEVLRLYRPVGLGYPEHTG